MVVVVWWVEVGGAVKNDGILIKKINHYISFQIYAKNEESTKTFVLYLNSILYFSNGGFEK